MTDRHLSNGHSSADEWMETNQLCPQQNGTKPPTAVTACTLVQSQDNDNALPETPSTSNLPSSSTAESDRPAKKVSVSCVSLTSSRGFNSLFLKL